MPDPGHRRSLVPDIAERVAETMGRSTVEWAGAVLGRELADADVALGGRREASPRSVRELGRLAWIRLYGSGEGAADEEVFVTAFFRAYTTYGRSL